MGFKRKVRTWHTHTFSSILRGSERHGRLFTYLLTIRFHPSSSLAAFLNKMCMRLLTEAKRKVSLIGKQALGSWISYRIIFFSFISYVKTCQYCCCCRASKVGETEIGEIGLSCILCILLPVLLRIYVTTGIPISKYNYNY